MIAQVLIAAQFTGLAVFAIGLGVLLFGIYAWVLAVHRRGIDRGWWK